MLLVRYPNHAAHICLLKVSLSVTCQLHDEAEMSNLKWSVSGNENNQKKCDIIHICTYTRTYAGIIVPQFSIKTAKLRLNY